MVVTREMTRPIRFHTWAFTSQHLLYLQDSDGDENHHLYCVEIYSDDTVADDPVDLTPFDEVQVRIEKMSMRRPSEILVGLNERDQEVHDLYLLDLGTGGYTPVQENPGFLGFVADEDLEIRLGLEPTPSGGTRVVRATPHGEWEEFLDIPMEDDMTTAPIGFDATGDTLYMRSSLNRNTAAVVAVDMGTGDTRVISEDPLCDVGDVLIHPRERTIQAVSYAYGRKQWEAVDQSVGPALELLQELVDGELSVVSRDALDERWIVSMDVDTGPTRYYLYDRGTGEAELLCVDRPALEDTPLARLNTAVIPSRDGRELVSYYTLPVAAGSGAIPQDPCPLVLVVHGGPWARDSWGYRPLHQWLADRGYAVLGVNFRGSTGFGKDFCNAGNLQWGEAMHDDLADAVQWATDRGIADPDRVAIMGGSYGGYATLVGLTRTPELFACGVDIVGPSSLVTLLETVPPYWAPMLEMLTTRMGDHRTEAGRALLEDRSPLHRVDCIERPLLIGQGANDPRVKQAESDRIVEAMQQRDIPVTYVLYPDEGHGFARPENNLSFSAVAEAFLSVCLGGRFEEVGRDFADSSIRVVAGAEHVRGLEEAYQDHLIEEDESY